MHKDCLEKKFRAETPTGVKLSRFFARGRPTASGGPLGVTFGPEIKNLCGNHMLCTFHILCQKKICYSFFRLYLVKIIHFMTIFNNSCFWSNHEKILTKNGQKMIQELIFGQL